VGDTGIPQEDEGEANAAAKGDYGRSLSRVAETKAELRARKESEVDEGFGRTGSSAGVAAAVTTGRTGSVAAVSTGRTGSVAATSTGRTGSMISSTSRSLSMAMRRVETSPPPIMMEEEEGGASPPPLEREAVP